MHDIRIILSRANRIATNADAEATAIALRDAAVTADQWLQMQPVGAKTEAVHEWLEDVEGSLGTMESEIDALCANCPV